MNIVVGWAYSPNTGCCKGYDQFTTQAQHNMFQVHSLGLYVSENQKMRSHNTATPKQKKNIFNTQGTGFHLLCASHIQNVKTGPVNPS